MPDFTITLSAAAVARLQVIVAAYNAGQGTNLTAREWMMLHLKELAISQELRASLEQIRTQAEADLQVAGEAEKERLLGAIE
jgi:hypothetical protein